AIANEDPPLALAMLTTIGDLQSDDLTILAASLTPAFQRAELVGPSQARACQLRWRARIKAALTGHQWADALLARFDSITTDWASVARRIVASLRPGDVPTLYGMGWNGQSLITELAAALPTTPIAWIDDTPAAAAPSSILAQRIGIQDLTLRH